MWNHLLNTIHGSNSKSQYLDYIHLLIRFDYEEMLWAHSQTVLECSDICTMNKFCFAVVMIWIRRNERKITGLAWQRQWYYLCFKMIAFYLSTSCIKYKVGWGYSILYYSFHPNLPRMLGILQLLNRAMLGKKRTHWNRVNPYDERKHFHNHLEPA